MARPTTRRSQRDASREERSGLSARTKVVWSALVLSMVGGAGLLVAVDGGAGLTLDGAALPSLAVSNQPASVEAIFDTREPLDRERWQSIVIHHSGTPYATPESLDRDHRAMGLHGLGYHFVIGSGDGLGDGEVHVGARWLNQQPGAHAAGPYADWYDRHSIGICLVGHGDRRPFTRAQLQRLTQLVSALARELDIPPDRILLHSDIASTTDPGWHFPEAAFREELSRLP
ncbi:MAG: peptidoglycan recognition family protein [Phycisphaerales bacterium JB037]